MTNDRFTATTATPEQVEAIRKFMEVMAQLEGKSVENIYTPGSSVRVTKSEGKYHAAIDVPIDNARPSND
jgi:hypothetical protein